MVPSSPSSAATQEAGAPARKRVAKPTKAAAPSYCPSAKPTRSEEASPVPSVPRRVAPAPPDPAPRRSTGPRANGLPSAGAGGGEGEGQGEAHHHHGDDEEGRGAGRMWRGREDLEKRLQYLSKEEASVQARMRRWTQFSRRTVRNIIVLSVFAEFPHLQNGSQKMAVVVVVEQDGGLRWRDPDREPGVGLDCFCFSFQGS
ncbi:hypothetical protein QYE76_034616 [Lolium multiflorum]|uniref:Uncharacterized protein n=1 Tax=Lolium multiflorum TaxID=4521 RepID=A0AAD8QXQ0_LOLMU|nr:hypothetical protein QYE76_034616 [Lolium multiflorum]